MLPAQFKFDEHLVIDIHFDDFLNDLYRLIDSRKQFITGENCLMENLDFH